MTLMIPQVSAGFKPLIREILAGDWKELTERVPELVPKLLACGFLLGYRSAINSPSSTVTLKEGSEVLAGPRITSSVLRLKVEP